MAPRAEDPWVRFTRHINFMPSGCWNWTAFRDKDGYGKFKLRVGKTVCAHRFSFEHWHGSVPVGMYLCHHCDNPSCVNPSHVFVGTQKDNCADAVAKGRNVFGVTHGRSKLNPDLVRQARNLSRIGVATRALARMFGVSKKTMRDAIDGTNWKSIGLEV